MNWPTHADYQDSIQNPQICFQEADLRDGRVVCDPLGLPRVMSGNFASVYELHTSAGRWAIRCFVRQVPGQQGRYSRLGQHLAGVRLECLVKFEYILKGILVHGTWYPIVRMQWVQGQQLDAYLADHVRDAAALRQLAVRWRVLLNQLRTHRLAHGDLQCGNVMVTPDGELRLVDYDGMYCPAFGRGHSPELGHTSFQHPRRTPEFYEERLDNFSALVIYTSLLAVAADPDLWKEFHSADNLLFNASDLQNTHDSPVLRRLKQSSDPAVRELAGLVRQCCIAPPPDTPWLEESIVALERGTLAALATSISFPTSMLAKAELDVSWPKPGSEASPPAGAAAGAARWR